MSGIGVGLRMESCMRGMYPLIAALALASPTAALAAGGQGQSSLPSGNSSIGPYVENVPGAGGNHPSSGVNAGGGGGTPGGGGSSSAISPATSQALAAHGSAGRAAA